MLDGLLRSLRGKPDQATAKPDGGDLLAYLPSYSPIRLPHPGIALTLSPEQVGENGTHWLTVMPGRLEQLHALLARFDIHWPADLSQCDHAALIAQTRSWATQYLVPLVARVPGDARMHWLQQHKDEDCAVFSLASDIALQLGELIIAKRPSYRWGMDQDSQNREDRMRSANQFVLLSHWIPDPSTQVEIHVESFVVNTLLDPDDSRERLFNTWLQMVDDAVSGRTEGDALAAT